MQAKLIEFSTYGNYHQNSSSIWDDEIIISDKLLPLLKLSLTVNHVHDLLRMCTYGSTNYRWSIDPFSTGSKIVNNRNRRTNWSDKFQLYTGFCSAIGYNKIEYENSKVGISQSSPWFVKAPSYDILILGTLKKPYFYESTRTYKSFTVKAKDIILFINEEKLHKNGAFMKSNYSVTVRGYLKKFLEKAKDQGINKIEVVKDEYLNTFIKQGANLNTNSIMDLMGIEKKVRDKVFSTLTPELIII